MAEQLSLDVSRNNTKRRTLLERGKRQWGFYYGSRARVFPLSDEIEVICRWWYSEYRQRMRAHWVLMIKARFREYRLSAVEEIGRDEAGDLLELAGYLNSDDGHR